MSDRTQVTLQLPTPVAEQLIASGTARPTLMRRSTIATVLVDVAAVTATAVSLLQAPETVTSVARALRDWLRRDHHEVPATLTASGPRGRFELEVTRDTDIKTIAKLLQVTIFAPEERRDQS